MNIKKELVNVISKFNNEKIDYALCGGWAVVIFGHMRVTKDIDILIQPNDLTKAEGALRDIDYIIKAGPMTFAGREIRRISKFEGPKFVTIDLILVNEQLQEIWDSRIKFSWQNRDLYIITKYALIKMKKIAGRAKDLEDIEELEKIKE